MKNYYISSYDKFTKALQLGGNDNKIVLSGKDAISAAKTFLKQNNDSRKPKRSASNEVNLCLNEVVYENGRMLLAGRSIWYQLN